MQYKFRLTYKPTDGGAEVTREGVKPIYGDDLTVVIAREVYKINFQMDYKFFQSLFLFEGFLFIVHIFKILHRFNHY